MLYISNTVKCTCDVYIIDSNLTELSCSCWEVLLQLSAAQQRCDVTHWKVCVKLVSKCPHLFWLHGWREILNPRFLKNTIQMRQCRHKPLHMRIHSINDPTHTWCFVQGFIHKDITRSPSKSQMLPSTGWKALDLKQNTLLLTSFKCGHLDIFSVW